MNTNERLGITDILLKELLRLAGITLRSDIIRCDAQEPNFLFVSFIQTLAWIKEVGSQENVREHLHLLALFSLSPWHLPVIIFGNKILIPNSFWSDLV